VEKKQFPSDDEKYQTILDKNSFFFQSDEFEKYEKVYENFTSANLQSLLKLRGKISSDGLKKEFFVEYIMKEKMGFQNILALIAFSQEIFLRLITRIRMLDDSELDSLINLEEWPTTKTSSEWGMPKIENLIKENKKIASGIINLLFEGSKNQKIQGILPMFEWKKLNLNKDNFSTEALLDTILRYKYKGSSKADSGSNAEKVIQKILKKNKIKFEQGKIKDIPRTMDAIIPDKNNPEIIIESSYQTTTASAQGDKAKTEGLVAKAIEKYYPDCIFVGFIDGAGWYARKSDLKRLTDIFKEVFTFEKTELIRFESFIKKHLSDKCYDAS